ncbi:MAG: ABC transporter permease [Anaerolineae bacterium]|nr:ABC transporter permease [Anaerolineae bacterium]
MNTRVILAIMRKDIMDAIKNQFILGFLVMPILVSLIFKVVFPNLNTDSLTIVVYNPGESRLVTALQELPDIQILAADSDTQVVESTRENQAVGGLVIPAAFDSSVDAGEQPELTAYLNYGQDEIKRRTFQRLVQQQVVTLTPPPANIVWAAIDAPSAAEAQASNYLAENFILVVMLVFPMATVGAMMIPLLLIEEKEKRTLSFLLASPASITDVVIGKALTGLMYSLTITGVVVALNQGWQGNWPITFLALILGLLFTVPVGLLIGAFFRNAMQLNTWGTVPIMLLLLPSWIATGQVLSPLLEAIMRLIPTYYLVDTLNLSLAGEGSLAQVGGNLAILSGCTVVAFAAAIWVLRWARE